MRALVLVLCAWLASALTTVAAEPGPIALSNQQLVDALADVREPVPGAFDLAMFGGFIAEDRPLRMQVGIVGAPAPATPPQMRELVRRGAAALPALLTCLDDRRPTGLVVGAPAKDAFPFMWTAFQSEYDPRYPKDAVARGDLAGARSLPPNGYTVKVADLCYVLIGQIVNRRVIAVRYQPSAGLVVNSPIETPWLRERAVADWTGVGPQDHLASLLSDLAAADQPYRAEPALRRLRFYYPQAYAKLSGDNAEKRRRFEADEAAGL